MPELGSRATRSANTKCPLHARTCGDGKGDLRAAITNFNQAVTNNLKDWHSFEKRGECLYQLGDYHLAIADFTSALQVNSKCADAYLWRGQCSLQIG